MIKITGQSLGRNILHIQLLRHISQVDHVLQRQVGADILFDLGNKLGQFQYRLALHHFCRQSLDKLLLVFSTADVGSCSAPVAHKSQGLLAIQVLVTLGYVYGQGGVNGISVAHIFFHIDMHPSQGIDNVAKPAKISDHIIINRHIEQFTHLPAGCLRSFQVINTVNLVVSPGRVLNTGITRYRNHGNLLGIGVYTGHYHGITARIFFGIAGIYAHKQNIDCFSLGFFGLH